MLKSKFCHLISCASRFIAPSTSTGLLDNLHSSVCPGLRLSNSTHSPSPPLMSVGCRPLNLQQIAKHIWPTVLQPTPRNSRFWFEFERVSPTTYTVMLRMINRWRCSSMDHTALLRFWKGLEQSSWLQVCSFPKFLEVARCLMSHFKVDLESLSRFPFYWISFSEHLLNPSVCQLPNCVIRQSCGKRWSSVPQSRFCMGVPRC